MKATFRKLFVALAFSIMVFDIPKRIHGKPQTPLVDESVANEALITDIQNIEIKCASNEIKIKIPLAHLNFNGMVYPQGLSKNSSCLREYESEGEYIEYSLPLRSCNTMSLATEGEEEYFNTIVLEPHPKLLTGQGRGFHVRCKYRRTPSTSPPVTMTISKGGREVRHEGNESISIGDPLQFQILLHSNLTTRFVVTDCQVRDGLGWAEEVLINSEGCPVDSDLLQPFRYEENRASVEFLAHKFPYSPTVYYSCSVKICKEAGDTCLPPICEGSKNIRDPAGKRKRDASTDEPATVQVYKGLWIADASESTEVDGEAEVLQAKEARGEVLCFSQRDFALLIAISGLILMTGVLLLLVILCLRRRRNFKGGSLTSSSLYSGSGTNFTSTGYTRGYHNTAFSQSSH